MFEKQVAWFQRLVLDGGYQASAFGGTQLFIIELSGIFNRSHIQTGRHYIYNMTEFAIELPFENILLRIAVHNDKRRTGSSLETPLFVTSVRRIVQVGQ